MKRIVQWAILVCFSIGVAYSYRAYSYTPDSTKTISAYEPDGSLRRDSLYQKDNTDSVFRYLRSTGQSLFLYRNRISVFSKNGLISNRVKFYCDSITPTTGDGQIVNISQAGFSQVLSVQTQVQTNTNVANDIPIVAVKSFTNSQVVLNIVQGNSATISILGTNVLGLRFAQSPGSSKVHILVVGY